jgi:hypothetical protein
MTLFKALTTGLKAGYAAHQQQQQEARRQQIVRGMGFDPNYRGGFQAPGGSFQGPPSLGPPVLQPLSLVPSQFAVGTPAGSIIGVLVGGSGGLLTLTDDFGGAVALQGSFIVVGLHPPLFGRMFVIKVTETLAGATNSPFTSSIEVTATSAAIDDLGVTGGNELGIASGVDHLGVLT